MKAEEYEAAVNALLEALGLDAGLTVEVRVQPHKATAKVLLTTDNIDGEVKDVEGCIYTDVVVKRDDIGASAKSAKLGKLVAEGFAKGLAEFNNANPAEVMQAMQEATKGTK